MNRQEQDKYQQAERKVAKMKVFYRHLTTWMFTSIFLMVLFFVLRLPPMITLVVVGGWGVAIAAEAIEVFGLPGMDRDWERRKIEEELQKMDDEEHDNQDDDDALDLEERPLPPREKQIRRNWNDSDLV